MNVSSVVKNRVSCVGGADRYARTGRRYSSSGGRLAIVSLSADPRAANVSPNPTRSCWIAVRVGGLNILNT